MKITLIGAGSIGTLFASILFDSGIDVILIEKKREIIDAITEHGLLVERNGSQKSFPVKITNDPNKGKDADLIMLTVKSYDNSAAAQIARDIASANTQILTLQNGIGNYETISNIAGSERTVVGTTTFGATQYQPGCTRGSADGSISIGEYHGGISDRILSLASILRQGGFTVNTVENVNTLIWTKLAVNVGINPIGALCRFENVFTSMGPAKEIQCKAVNELIAVAKAKGIELDYEHLCEHVSDVSEATRVNRCSMLQDVENHNLTEISSINGAVVQEGKAYGIATPVNEVLTSLVKSIEIYNQNKQ